RAAWDNHLRACRTAGSRTSGRRRRCRPRRPGRPRACGGRRGRKTSAAALRGPPCVERLVAGRDGAALGRALFRRRRVAHALALAAVLALAAILVALAAAHALARVDAHAMDRGGGLLAGGGGRALVRGLAATGGGEQAGRGDRDHGSGADWILHIDSPLRKTRSCL